MTIDRKKRPRRIAADEAHAWARNLKLGNIHAKLILSMLTLYVDHEGAAFVAIPSLAEDCELSPDTVRRRLVWLEDIGAIVRVPQWLDENGNRNSASRGKRTSDLIRLQTQVDTDVIEARAAGDIAAETSTETEVISPSQQQGLNPPPETVSPAPALGQPSHCGEGLTSEPEPESSPQPPSGGSVALEGWLDFEKDWSEPILRQTIAQAEWRSLSPDQRHLARQAARGYVIWRKEQKKPPNVLSAHLFLREKDAWQGFAARAPDAPRPTSGGFPVDSPQGRAIIALYAVARTAPRESHGRVSYSVDLTPQLMAFADCGRPSEWAWIEDRNQIGAWSQFLAHHVKGSRPEIVTTRGIGESMRKGIHAPGPWPPKKDGTWSQADDGLTNEDMDALASEGQR